MSTEIDMGQLTPPEPATWVHEQVRTPEQVRAARRPGAVRTLSAIIRAKDRSWIEAAVAFEYPANGDRTAYWCIDVENPAITAAGIHLLAAGEVGRGFAVRDEQAARDWLHFFGALTAAAMRAGVAE